MAAGVIGAGVAHGSITQYKSAVTGEPGLVSYYTFDAGTAADSKASNNGTAAGTVNYDAGPGGGANKALSLKGTGHINLGQVSDFDFPAGVGTVEAWVRPGWGNSPGYNPAIFANRDGGPVNWSVHMEGSKMGVGLWNGTSYEPRSIPNAGTNWHHLAVVFDVDSGTGGSTFTIYWDGNSIGSTSQALPGTPDLPTEIASSSVGGGERWNGGLDEVAFYNTALSAGAIKAHYTAFLLGDPPVITSQPQGGIFLTGVPLTLSVEVKGADLNYQWTKDNNPIAGATNASLSFASAVAGDAGTYQVTVSNTGGQVKSAEAVVQFGDLPARLTQYQNAVRAEQSLISYYTFDHLDAKDSKSTNDGTPQGKVPFGNGIGGEADKALALDGTGHINLGLVDAFDFAGGAGTIEAWVRAGWTPGLGYNPTIFGDRDGGPVNWSIHMNDGKDAVGMWNGNGYTPQPTPGTGTAWHHLAVVFDLDTDGNNTFNVYWDGTLTGSVIQGVGGTPDLPTELGSASAAGQERWVGGLDEVAFYSEALSATAIQAHYSAFVSGSAPTISLQPVGGDFFLGSPATLTAGAQGLNLSYQWFKDGTAIPEATNSTLALPALTAADAGAYLAKVTNPSGTVSSATANVNVITPNLPAYQQAVRAEGSLISYYTFDASDAKDSKSTNDGTVVDPVVFGTGIGAGSDRALVLDGTGHVNLGQVDAFDFASGKGTVEAWIQAGWGASPGYNPAIFADRDGGPVNWSIHMNAGKDATGLWNGSTYQALPVPRNGLPWHHLAVVFDTNTDGSSFSLYWDGVLAGTTTQGIGQSPDSPTELGSSSPDGQEHWIGSLDEVAFYGAALGASQIQAHYQAMIGAPAPAPALAFAVAGTKLTLSWPASVAGFTLQSTPSLTAPTWTAVPGVAGNSATVDVASGTAFYRLKKQ